MSCINPNTGVNYQVGDIGPAGGIRFSIPGHSYTTPNNAQTINNNTNYLILIFFQYL